ncbi:virion morphogenesis protein [Grimontia hollisae]|uniref:virion morphogenesis protein n=1 Tax=Grimontia hollisae TaxID=673 RepID=UPI00165E76BE|nr:virion morphogenesis protein [Grimontia hollisae]
MPPTVKLSARDALNFQEKLALLALPPKKRFWILKTLGRWEKQNVRKRIRQQKDIHGKSLAPRKRKKGRKKMYRRMAKGLEPYVKSGGKELDLTWRNKMAGRTAARHHIGQTQRMTARQMEKRWGKPDYKAPATKGQARKMRELGFEVTKGKSKKSKPKKPSLKWIMENLSQGKAGVIIRVMSDKPQQTAWDIPLAERQILGSKHTDVNRQLVKIFGQAQKRK